MGVNRLLELPRPVIWKDPNLEVTRFPIESNKIIKTPTQNTDMIKIKLTYNKFTMTFTIIKNKTKKISRRDIREYLKFKNQKTLKIIFTSKTSFNKNRKIF